MHITYKIMEPLIKGKFVQHFVPFMLMIIGGSFVVREFAQIKYKYRKAESLNVRDKLKKEGLITKEPVTIEEEYDKLKTLDTEDWENIRIPRPWEAANNAN